MHTRARETVPEKRRSRRFIAGVVCAAVCAFSVFFTVPARHPAIAPRVPAYALSGLDGLVPAHVGRRERVRLPYAVAHRALGALPLGTSNTKTQIDAPGFAAARKSVDGARSAARNPFYHEAKTLGRRNLSGTLMRFPAQSDAEGAKRRRSEFRRPLLFAEALLFPPNRSPDGAKSNSIGQARDASAALCKRPDSTSPERA